LKIQLRRRSASPAPRAIELTSHTAFAGAKAAEIMLLDEESQRAGYSDAAIREMITRYALFELNCISIISFLEPR